MRKLLIIYFKSFLFLIIVTFISSCGPGAKSLFAEKDSPDKRFTFEISVAEPKKIIGCEFCRRPFYIFGTVKNNTNSEKFWVFETRLENDGVPFDERNISLRWVSKNKLIVCLRASDLPKKGYHVSLENKPIVSYLNNC